MSQEAAKAFIERMKGDEALRERVLAAEGLDARLAIINAEGFDCSVEEIGAVQELADAELDGVAGGKPHPGSGQWDGGPCWYGG